MKFHLCSGLLGIVSLLQNQTLAGSATVTSDQRLLAASVVVSRDFPTLNYSDNGQVNDTSPQTHSNGSSANTTGVQYAVHGNVNSSFVPVTPGTGNSFDAISFNGDLLSTATLDAANFARHADEFWDNRIRFQVTQPTDWSWTGTFSSTQDGLGTEYAKVELTDLATNNDVLFDFLLNNATGTDSTPFSGTLAPGSYQLVVQADAQVAIPSSQQGSGVARVTLENGLFSFTALPEPADLVTGILCAGVTLARRRRIMPDQ